MSITEETRPAQKNDPSSQPPLVIGIGASAGGLEALQQFFWLYAPQQRPELRGDPASVAGL